MIKKQLTLTVHGLSSMNERVVAAEFHRQLGKLLNGLKTADKKVNGGKRHDYTISDLRIGSAEVALDEFVSSKKIPEISSIEAYSSCIVALGKSDFRSALEYGTTVDSIASMTEGVGENFKLSEIKFNNDVVVRIDKFLQKQAESAIKIRTDEDKSISYFVGTSHGSFDGKIKEVDLRSAQPEVKLVLTAGGVEIDCITEGIEVDEIRDALDRRAWVEGDAIYTGQKGLPERLVIRVIKLVDNSLKIEHWKGSFDPYDISGWESEE